MILDFNKMIEKYSIQLKGVLHVGAHYGQEYDLYKQFDIPVIFFEPTPSSFRILESKVGDDINIECYQCALGNVNGKIDMNVEVVNQGQSSSILKPKKHLQQYPHITFNQIQEVAIFRLEDLIIDFPKYNFMNIDVQGYELEVLKGASGVLPDIDYIISEVNCDEVYEGCPDVSELDSFLSSFGFVRVETDWAGGIWGDALYIKNK